MEGVTTGDVAVVATGGITAIAVGSVVTVTVIQLLEALLQLQQEVRLQQYYR